MQSILTFLIVLCSALLMSSCDQRPDTLETFFGETEFDFITHDKDTLEIQINFRFNILRSTREQLENRYASSGYRDSLLIPIITSVSDSVLKAYSASGIYSDKRTQAERKLTFRVRRAFSAAQVELVEIFIASVEMSDNVRARLEQEYMEKIRREELSHPFELKINDRTNWNIRIDTLEPQEFDAIKCQTRTEYLNPINGDSLLWALAGDYSTIVVSDSCSAFKALDQTLQHCRRSQGEDKSWTGYKAIAYKNNWLMIESWAYEDASTLCFNPVTQHYAYFTFIPHSIGSDIVWSADDFYGDSEFVIADLRTGKYFGFRIYSWNVTGYCRQGKTFLMGFQSGTKQKYLKLTM
jgi:SPFH domain / Band 7 family